MYTYTLKWEMGCWVSEHSAARSRGKVRSNQRTNSRQHKDNFRRAYAADAFRYCECSVSTCRCVAQVSANLLLSVLAMPDETWGLFTEQAGLLGSGRCDRLLLQHGLLVVSPVNSRSRSLTLHILANAKLTVSALQICFGTLVGDTRKYQHDKLLI